MNITAALEKAHDLDRCLFEMACVLCEVPDATDKLLSVRFARTKLAEVIPALQRLVDAERAAKTEAAT